MRYSHNYRATDADNDPVTYDLRSEEDKVFFKLESIDNADGEPIAVLKLKQQLVYETAARHTIEILARDTDGDTDQVRLEVEVINTNDERAGV